MDVIVREMRLEEVGVIVDYFHGASPQHLEMLGVDPARLPDRDRWIRYYAAQYSQPLEKREAYLLIWKSQDRAIGFSSTDNMVVGEHAYMHFHIVQPELRNGGYGSACLRETVRTYFEALNLQRIFCEPNAFNMASNRTLQRVGFKYLKTHMTVPSQLAQHQAVTRWVLEK